MSRFGGWQAIDQREAFSEARLSSTTWLKLLGNTEELRTDRGQHLVTARAGTNWELGHGSYVDLTACYVRLAGDVTGVMVTCGVLFQRAYANTSDPLTARVRIHSTTHAGVNTGTSDAVDAMCAITRPDPFSDFEIPPILGQRFHSVYANYYHTPMVPSYARMTIAHTFAAPVDRSQVIVVQGQRLTPSSPHCRAWLTSLDVQEIY